MFENLTNLISFQPLRKAGTWGWGVGVGVGGGGEEGGGMCDSPDVIELTLGEI